MSRSQKVPNRSWYDMNDSAGNGSTGKGVTETGGTELLITNDRPHPGH